MTCQLYEQRDLVHSSGLSPETEEEIKKNIYTSSSNSVVQDIKTEKTFNCNLPVLFDKCFLTPTFTADVYKEYTTACPLLPAAKIKRVLLANSVINFI